MVGLIFMLVMRDLLLLSRFSDTQTLKTDRQTDRQFVKEIKKTDRFLN